MNKTYLLLDCNYLCYRAKYTTGGLAYAGSPTGVIYGFLMSLVTISDFFNTSNFVFCWDSRTSKRLEIYPEYKSHRLKKEYTEEETAFENEFRKQMKKLRTTYLPMIGFNNIFAQKGYEADDVIASLCLHTIVGDNDGVIVSSDEDLYQCIESNISFYNPRTGKILTLQGFKKKYGIDSMLWGMVKSIAGCTTDNVKGVRGVGEKRAIDFLLSRLNPDSKAYKDITSPEGNRISDRNQELVVLPMKGTHLFKLKKDELSEKGWMDVTGLLGMKSIRNRMPFGRLFNGNE